MQITFNAYWYIDSKGWCVLDRDVAASFVKRQMNAGVFARPILTLIALWGAWKKNPKVNQKTTRKAFMIAAFGETSLPVGGI